MTNKHTQNDLMEKLFKQLPEKHLPADFRTSVMQQIMDETARIKKRNERLGLIAVIVASAFMMALAVLALIVLKIPTISFQLPSVVSLSFYGYIGIYCLFLLLLDYVFRKKFRKKHDSYTKYNEKHSM